MAELVTGSDGARSAPARIMRAYKGPRGRPSRRVIATADLSAPRETHPPRSAALTQPTARCALSGWPTRHRPVRSDWVTRSMRCASMIFQLQPHVKYSARLSIAEGAPVGQLPVAPAPARHLNSELNYRTRQRRAGSAGGGESACSSLIRVSTARCMRIMSTVSAAR